MKSNKENWEQFSGPMKQALENLSHIKDNISDTIADKMEEMKEGAEETTQDQPKEKGGCLKKILIYGFVVIAIVAFLRNGCSFNSTIERDNTGGETTQSQTDKSSNESQSLYNQYVQMTEENIAELVAQESIDTAALEEEYEFLLTCKMSEYVFKVMATGHFTGDYETKEYEDVLESCGTISEEMKKYFDAETAEGLYSYVAIVTTEEYDDEVFDYDAYIVGTAQSPDIDAMWYSYFNSLVEAKG